MNRVLVLVLMMACAVPAIARTTKCGAHQLSIQMIGHEHVSHRVRVDGVTVKEIEQELWFVQKVACISGGFLIEADHAQYGDNEKRRLVLKVLKGGKYELR